MGLYDVEDDEDLDDGSRPHVFECAECEEQILPELDDTVLLHVEEIDGYDTPPRPRLSENGEPLYEPLFYCFRCYEELIEQLRLLTKDQYHGDADQFPIRCEFCGGGVDFGEALVTCTVGEIVFSKKQTGLTKFEASGQAQFMCLACGVQISGALDDEDEASAHLWGEGLNEAEECPRCTMKACWRHDTCACDCHWRR